MDVMSVNDTCELQFPSNTNHEILQISCNWQVTNNKQFCDAITTSPLRHAPERISCEDMVSFETCISLQSVDSKSEPCMLDIKVTNCQKIARIAVASQANLIEFFKQSGEYEKTIIAEFIDAFEDNYVYLAETEVHPPTNEASIKFARTRINRGNTMWLYGIRLILTDPVKESKPDAFNYEVIQTFLSNINGKSHKGVNIAKKILECFNTQEVTNTEQFCQKNLRALTLDDSLANSIECTNEMLKDDEKENLNYEDDSKKLDVDVKAYIDNKFHDMERRLMRRIEEMEVNTNQKLDVILKRLETQLQI